MSSSIPASLKSGPSTTNTLVSKGYLVIYFIIMWLSIMPPFLLTLIFLDNFKIEMVYLLWSFPLFLIIGYLVLFFSVIFWSWVILKVVNWIHPPKEGVFPREAKNKDFRFWSLRSVIKKLPLWISHNSPIPWGDSIAFKLFGNHVSMKTPLFDAWIDAEFLEIGTGTTIGQGAVIMTSMITVEFLIIKPVKIGKDCLIGAHSVVSPGTQIEDQVILGALSSTTLGQHLESSWVYWGNPAIKFKEMAFRERDTLSPEERAKMKKYREVTEELSDTAELKGRKSAKAFIQIQKSDYKERKASRLQARSDYQRSKAAYKARKLELRADKKQIRAEKQSFDSLRALEKAKLSLEAKIQKNRSKLDSIEKKEFEKESKRLEKKRLKKERKLQHHQK
ncbi:hypothetical protein NEF87_002205 [Candidatus Lokiarchaeum ossiferum]|uniref:Acetyltransferase n=1 Tax=Candidatus Lokiarchaeum ossiferum TaxID=2951803 RepID=A0ABY6HR93_9ARCH|nr:hypothetical protein NEF87_002205 [Candidatus Lokiarchaeum sp. B-35]